MCGTRRLISHRKWRGEVAQDLPVRAWTMPMSRAATRDDEDDNGGPGLVRGHGRAIELEYQSAIDVRDALSIELTQRQAILRHGRKCVC
jgi:hypothetical protein